MEPMQCEEIARNAILEQLRRRELFVANAQNLSLEELQQIYNGFIVPHPRRERRERQRPKSMDEMPMEMEKLMKRIKVVNVAGEKRSGDLETAFSGCAPKRFKDSTGVVQIRRSDLRLEQKPLPIQSLVTPIRCQVYTQNEKR